MQPTQEMDVTRVDQMLAVALELSSKSWKVGLHDGRRERASIYTLKQEVAGAVVMVALEASLFLQAA